MAQGSQIYKIDFTYSDPEKSTYFSHKLTIARHPSETILRLCARILAYAYMGDEELTFTRGLCVSDEPDLWSKDILGDILYWIELGQPDPERLRKACNKSQIVNVFTYQDEAAKWLEKNAKKFAKLEKLRILSWPAKDIEGASQHLKRSSTINIIRYDQMLMVSLNDFTFEIEPKIRA